MVGAKRRNLNDELEAETEMERLHAKLKRRWRKEL